MLNNFLKKIKDNSKTKGFTLIEALVSIALILAAVIGPLTLTMNAINSIMQSKNKVVASYLAEEIIENFRNTRDNFALTCGNIYFEFDAEYTKINQAYCGENDNGLSIPTIYIGNQDLSSTPNTNPREIAWKMFLKFVFNIQDLHNISSEDFNLDNDSFGNINNSDSLASKGDSCTNLFFDSIDGYTCSGGSSTIFKRTITVTKVSETSLKIEVSVVYTNSSISGVKEKAVSVVDYIYQR